MQYIHVKHLLFYAMSYAFFFLIFVFYFLIYLFADDKWERIFIGILIFLGIVATLLEAFTWYIVLRRRKTGSDKHSHSMNGAHAANGVNEYGARGHGV